nr:MAG: hypothetical protein DIU60_19980 [Actinomycetota bacterium]
MRLFRRLDERRRARRRADDADLDALLALVAETLGFTHAFSRDGSAMLLTGPRTVTVRLAGLRREAARRPREDWPALASEHLVRTLAQAAEALDVCDFAQARPLLRPRVLLAADLAAAGIPDPSRMIGRRLDDELVEVLTVGYGTRVRPVRPEEAYCWPVTPGEALDIAAGNALADERLTPAPLDLGGITVTKLSGYTASAAAHLRALSSYLAVPRDGALVALPHPGQIVVHPVAGLNVVRAIERMRLYAHRVYTDHPEGLSPQVYWWRSGRLVRIPAEFARSGERRVKLVVSPPPEFARVLTAMAQRRSG